jgi:hypothetical protein
MNNENNEKNHQNLVVSVSSPSVSFNETDLLNNTFLDINRNQLNQSTTLSQPSSYQTINNIIPSTNNTLIKNSNIDYSIKYLANYNEKAVKNASSNRTSPEKNADHETMGNKLRAKSLIEYNRRKEELQQFYQRLLRMINDSINIIKAVMMRLIFSLHSIIAISYVYIVKRDEWYFVNVVGVVFMMIELFITIIKRRGLEPTGYL